MTIKRTTPEGLIVGKWYVQETGHRAKLVRLTSTFVWLVYENDKLEIPRKLRRDYFIVAYKDAP